LFFLLNAFLKFAACADQLKFLISVYIIGGVSEKFPIFLTFFQKKIR